MTEMLSTNNEGDVTQEAIGDVAENVEFQEPKSEYLTAKEIAEIRSEETSNEFGLRIRKYKNGEDEVALLRRKIYLTDPEYIKNKDKFTPLFAKKEEGEAHFGERILVNTLLEQGNIAEEFGLPRKGLWDSMRPNFTSDSAPLMTDVGEVNMISLDKHLEVLRERKASEDQIIIELSGHVFHEAVHKGELGLGEALLGKDKRPLGELTPVTAQLAYYISKGYKGPSSYSNKDLIVGHQKIKESAGFMDYMDYDVVTSVGSEMIFEALATEYPEIAEKAKNMTSMEACEYITTVITPQERERLIPCLKKAIARSADLQEFSTVVDKIREEK